jgi:hypothetical protein
MRFIQAAQQAVRQQPSASSRFGRCAPIATIYHLTDRFRLRKYFFDSGGVSLGFPGEMTNVKCFYSKVNELGVSLYIFFS